MTRCENYSLTERNTFGITATCKHFIEVNTVEEAAEVVATTSLTTEPLLLLGGGSNLLFTRNFPGTVLHAAIKGMEVTDETDKHVLIRCGSGENWDDVVAYCVSRGYAGIENLSLIPGEAGASAVQNIGAYGVEAGDYIHTVEAVEIGTGKRVTIAGHNCGYAYRHSKFKAEWKNKYLITRVTYRLNKAAQLKLDYGNIRHELEKQGITSPTLLQLRQTIIRIREEKLPDPKVEGNAGSFFMNPTVPETVFRTLIEQHPDMPHYPADNGKVKLPAAWLIDQCGWKGKTLGRAGVHHRQALVLVNKGGATGEEVVTLCKAIQHDVEQRFGLQLIPEVNIL